MNTMCKTNEKQKCVPVVSFLFLFMRKERKGKERL